jgi:predicted metalloprotease
VLSGCSGSFADSLPSDVHEPVHVTQQQVLIIGATDNPVDQLVRDAIADLETFWSEAYPQYYGAPFAPLKGGYFSVDSTALDPSAYPPTGIGCADAPEDPKEVAGNALYNPRCDAIAYDRALLKKLSSAYGEALSGVVLAHEFGHAIQARAGYPAGGRSINDETQADCFAGAWTAWVADGKADHTTIRTRELDNVLRGYLLLRDPVGSDPNNSQAHGSYFDRASAFTEGHDDGVASCRDDFGPARLFTAQTFNQDDLANRGNADYATTLQTVDTTLPPFWTAIFQQDFGKQFQPPAIRPFDRTPPPCRGDPIDESRDLDFCPSDSTVYYDQTDLVLPAYQKLGDFAVPTAISLPYGLAARSQLDLSTDDEVATRSAVCLSGWYGSEVFHGAFTPTTGIRISPGDIDEALTFLLTYGVSDRVFPHVRTTGFELFRAYRAGFLDGGPACDVGL